MIRGASSALEEKLLIWLSVPIVAAHHACRRCLPRPMPTGRSTAYAAGTILAVWMLQGQRRGLLTSLIINGIPAVLLPLLTVFADRSEAAERRTRDEALRRPQRRSASRSPTIAGEAHRTSIVADNRDILADLFYTLRDKPLRIYARDLGGFPDELLRAEVLPARRNDGQNVLYSSRPSRSIASTATVKC